MEKTEHANVQEYHKANQASGYNFKNTYCEITEEEYWYMLEVLPPAKMDGGAFLMSEHNHGPLVNGAVMFGSSLKKTDDDKFYIFTIDANDWNYALRWIYKNLKPETQADRDKRFESKTQGFRTIAFEDLTIEFFESRPGFFYIEPNELMINGLAFDAQSTNCLLTVYSALNDTNKQKTKDIILKDVYKFANFLDHMWAWVK